MSTLNPAPQLAPIMLLNVDLEPPQIIGQTQYGLRQIVPIRGGRFEGERLNGSVLAGGADWNVTRADGVIEIHARYTLKTHDGALIYIINDGLSRVAPEIIAKVLAGEQVDLKNWYFRSAPRFETAAPQYQWLHRSLFVGDLLPPRGLNVRIQVYEVL
ncbi:DUF3237 domain-containing protein [Burkholderia ambifaria]|uniref:DUF3237 domain-containing protein n=1 Tax=Burkholderia ambifaria TaxID=152480 RepID=UPI000F808628|nr:DUF3237 domain-containing protein [Burkholderia ambifaria]